MTVGELLQTLPSEEKIEIRFVWLSTHPYRKNEITGLWEYYDGGYWITDYDANDEENLNDPNFDPSVEYDEEYSFEGRAGHFLEEKGEDYDWILEEEVEQIADGKYEIRKYSYD